jgi:hypothetical protein
MSERANAPTKLWNHKTQKQRIHSSNGVTLPQNSARALRARSILIPHGGPAFGYETDKFGISQACGEHALFPAVREAELCTLIIADGFSCREQIEQSTGSHYLPFGRDLQMSLQ